MNKLKFLLVASVAAILTLSCAAEDDETTGSSDSNNTGVSSSSDGSSGGNSSPSDGSFNTEATYTIYKEDGDDPYFQYDETENEKDEQCLEGEFYQGPSMYGPYYSVVGYSISNNILTWTYYPGAYDEVIYFNGNSSTLTGTWTRSVNMDVDCENDNDGAGYYGCKHDYDIVKAVFSGETVKISRNNCPTKWYNTGDPWGIGWTVEVVDCSTLKIKKGANTVTKKITKTGFTYTFGTKNCTYQNLEFFSKKDKEDACKEAYDTFGEDEEYWDLASDYDIFLNGEYYVCVDPFPNAELDESFWADSDSYYDKPQAKQLFKAKATAKGNPKFKKSLKKQK